MSKYPFTDIEKKWQKYWEEHDTFHVTEDPSFPKDKRLYVLDMFPYPSGAGLHTGTHPRVTTRKNIDNFRRQIKSLGMCYDWDREISTCEEDYYHWTQWIFLQLYKKGLAYEAHTPINWCPSCKTGLANEEVKEGKCERCGSPVERKNIRQWMLKITAYADELLKGLDDLDWSESVKLMQRNWIGRSEGAAVFFDLENMDEKLEVYTTRCDTLFGATYMVIAPEHPLVSKLTTAEQKDAVEAYIKEAARKSDLDRTDLAKEKTGVFSGSYAINPVNGKKIPIWIADYVLISYGTGAIMAVPAHDTRDWEFAKKFNLPIIEVLKSEVDVQEQAWTEDGIHVNSGFLDGLNKADAIAKMLEFLEEKKCGHKAVNYKLRDWVFSRQRYWGEPIPLIHCDHCGIVPVPEDQLPLTLPEVSKYEPSGTGESPLVNIDSWVNTTCPVCGRPAKRETNTMPQWAGSCWYYLRYIDPRNEKAFVDPEKEKYWMPVDLYIGGAEHAVLHLLYARFWHHVLYDLGLVSTKEPFQKLVNQGMITSFAYKKKNGIIIATDKVSEKSPGVFVETETDEPVEQIVTKMSKSLKNVINPDNVIRDYGADTMRVYEMFMGPLTMSKPWSTQGTIGVYRFLDRIWRIATEKKIEDIAVHEELNKTLHKTIKKVTNDTATLNFNTAISQMMVLVNEMNRLDVIPKTVLETLALLLSPYTPHLAEELWEMLGHKPSIANETWPSYDEALCSEDTIEMVVQVNGKLRARIPMLKSASKEEMLDTAKKNEKIIPYLDGKILVKEIVVPGKLVNLVVK